jgi:hypothetical protein
LRGQRARGGGRILKETGERLIQLEAQENGVREHAARTPLQDRERWLANVREYFCVVAAVQNGRHSSIGGRGRRRGNRQIYILQACDLAAVRARFDQDAPEDRDDRSGSVHEG